MWVFEGINKIGEGWLEWSLGSRSGWMFSPGVVQSGTEALTSGGDDLFGALDAAGDLFGDDLFGAVADTGADAISAVSAVATGSVNEGTIWDFTQPILDLNGAVATWFRTTFMDNLMAFIPFQAFQLIVILTEMAIGLAMIGGLFTWWAAVVSIVMCIIFTLSGLFYWYQLWFIFGGFLLLGGAGRAFGLDCWVVPLFKKWWNGTRFARRRHWYLDGPSK
jgi:NADH dehydrogenase